MLKFHRILLTLSLAAACSLPAGAEDVSLAQAAPFQLAQASRVTDRSRGFSIVPPKGWTRDDATEDMLVFVDDQNGMRGGHMSVALVHSSTPLENLGPMLKAEFSKKDASWKLKADGMVKVAGQKTYYINGLFNVGDNKLQVMQFYIQGKAGQVYILIYTVLQESYKKYEPSLKTSAASFKLL